MPQDNDAAQERPIDNPPAFPRPASEEDNGNYERPAQEGMSLRDWFAGQVIAGLAANPHIIAQAKSEIVNTAYGFADAMLARRAA